MLCLTRKQGETLIIGGMVRVTINAIRGDRVILGVEAPEEVRVDRLEVHDRRELEAGDAG